MMDLIAKVLGYIIMALASLFLIFLHTGTIEDMVGKERFKKWREHRREKIATVIVICIFIGVFVSVFKDADRFRGIYITDKIAVILGFLMLAAAGYFLFFLSLAWIGDRIGDDRVEVWIERAGEITAVGIIIYLVVMKIIQR